MSSHPKSHMLLERNQTCIEGAEGRVGHVYADLGERFSLKGRRHTNQYAQLYFQRLMNVSPRLSELATRKWKAVQKSTILDVQKGQDCWVLGTLYKHMKKKPCVLDEYNIDFDPDQEKPEKYTAEDDYLIMEDEGARMKLIGDALPMSLLVTGVMIAVRGKEVEGGDFQVSDVCFQTPQLHQTVPEVVEDKYVALVSGLDVGDAKDPLKTLLLVQYLIGSLGSEYDQVLSSKITRVVIAGNAMAYVEPPSQKVGEKQQKSRLTEPLKELEVYLSQLAAAMPLDIMPGTQDPANLSLPQQPLHACMCGEAGKLDMLNRVYNPHNFSVDGVEFLGTSGQNIDDMYRFSSERDRLKLLEMSLTWGHVVPTAPDTLPCFPFSDKDPFIIQSCPHVYFAGNQPQYSQKLVRCSEGTSTRLITVPSFAQTGTVVLVNTRTLKCHPITFDVSAIGA